MTHTSEQIKNLLQKGESQNLEFKLRFRDPNALATLIASFANTDGGLIITGVNETAEIVGTDPKQFQSLYENALKRLNAKPNTKLEIVNVQGKQVAVVSVEKSNNLVLSNQGAFQRRGERTIPMPTSNISTALAQQNTLPSENVMLAEGIARLTGMVEQLQENLDYANSFRGQVKNYLIGGFFGAIIGLILTALYKQ